MDRVERVVLAGRSECQTLASVGGGEELRDVAGEERLCWWC
jgi:hypothetical protein